MYENIKYEVNEGLAIVTINRHKAMNALNMDVLSQLSKRTMQLRVFY